MLEFKPISHIKDRVYERYLEERTVVINDYIEDDVIERVVLPIFKWNKKDDDREEKEKDFKRDDKDNIIKIYVNSYGGSAYDCLSVMSAILSSKTPIYTYALGKSMSAGLKIFLAGHKRFIQKYTTLMYHDVQQYLGQDSITSHKFTIEEGNRLMRELDQFIISRTKVTQNELDKYKNSHPHEWYIDSQAALKYGFAHEII